MSKVTPEHVEARTRAILQAACAVFARKGYMAATMQDVAREAGLTAGALYRYFANKDDLVQAVFDQSQVYVRPLVDQVDGAGCTLDAIAKLGELQLEWLRSASARQSLLCHFEALVTAARDPGGLGQRTRAASEELVRAVQQQAGAALAAGVDPRVLGQLIVACLKGINQMELEAPGSLDPRQVHLLLLSLIRPMTTSGGTPHGADPQT